MGYFFCSHVKAQFNYFFNSLFHRVMKKNISVRESMDELVDNYS